MDKDTLALWVRGGTPGRGAWLARAVGIHKQSLWQMYMGKRPIGQHADALRLAMQDREHAERIMRAGAIKKPTNGS